VDDQTALAVRFRRADRQDDVAAGRESCGQNHRHVAAQQSVHFLPGGILIGDIAEGASRIEGASLALSADIGRQA
jgi:hypothetical protein